MRRLLFVIFVLATTASWAQTFTERLQKSKPGEGSVAIFQDQTITDLVNGTKRKTEPSKAAKPEEKVVQSMADTTATGDASKSKAYKRSYAVSGYRLQLFLGDDSRVSRQKAYAAGSRFKGVFPDVPVYTHFYAPHWICRAGDFQTFEEASGYLHKLQEIGGFKEASIVKCKIQIPY